MHEWKRVRQMHQLLGRALMPPSHLTAFDSSAGTMPGGSEAAAGADVALAPTLMNKQAQIAFCLADCREWSRPLQIHTVGACLNITFCGVAACCLWSAPVFCCLACIGIAESGFCCTTMYSLTRNCCARA